MLLEKLWQEYKFEKNVYAREKIVLKCLPMINAIAQRLSLYLQPCCDTDDLVSDGLIGLLDAIEKYDPKKQSKFKTYAAIRIRGAMLDTIRKTRWATTVFQRKIKKLMKTNTILEQKLLRHPTEEELAEEMNMELDQFRKMMLQIGPSVIFIGSHQAFEYENMELLESSISDEMSINPEEHAISDEISATLINAIKCLPKKSAIVISLYYYEEMTMKEIAKVLSITESRVCQIHAQALLRLFQIICSKIKSCEI
ncbi:TPA: FliA/WhiG family RNA polymerase sigma factor [bacterium]|nr:FliA/WhiG family RNA polymerase sigma factor [bacterium]